MYIFIWILLRLFYRLAPFADDRANGTVTDSKIKNQIQFEKRK